MQMGRKEALKLKKQDPSALLAADLPDCPIRLRPCAWEKPKPVVDAPPAPAAEVQYPEVIAAPPPASPPWHEPPPPPRMPHNAHVMMQVRPRLGHVLSLLPPLCERGS